eukprot:gene7782-973_t
MIATVLVAGGVSTWLFLRNRGSSSSTAAGTKMSASQLVLPKTETETLSKDAEALLEIYDKVEAGFLTNGLDMPAIKAQQPWFHGVDDAGDTPWPRKYSQLPNPLPEHAVRILVVPISDSPMMANMAASITRDLLGLFPPTAKVFSNSRTHYHCTVFHTSHPADPRPNALLPDGGVTDPSSEAWERRASNPAELRREREAMQKVVEGCEPPVLRLDRVVMASSGTLLLTWVDLTDNMKILRTKLRAAFPVRNSDRAATGMSDPSVITIDLSDGDEQLGSDAVSPKRPGREAGAEETASRGQNGAGGLSSATAAPAATEDDQATTCTICFDEIGEQGPHRAACLRAKKSDLVDLFNMPKVQPTDAARTQELEQQELEQQLEAERRETQKLKREMEELRKAQKTANKQSKKRGPDGIVAPKETWPRSYATRPEAQVAAPPRTVPSPWAQPPYPGPSLPWAQPPLPVPPPLPGPPLPPAWAHHQVPSLPQRATGATSTSYGPYGPPDQNGPNNQQSFNSQGVQAVRAVHQGSGNRWGVQHPVGGPQNPHTAPHRSEQPAGGTRVPQDLHRALHRSENPVGGTQGPHNSHGPRLAEQDGSRHTEREGSRHTEREGSRHTEHEGSRHTEREGSRHTEREGSRHAQHEGPRQAPHEGPRHAEQHNQFFALRQSFAPPIGTNPQGPRCFDLDLDEGFMLVPEEGAAPSINKRSLLYPTSGDQPPMAPPPDHSLAHRTIGQCWPYGVPALTEHPSLSTINRHQQQRRGGPHTPDNRGGTQKPPPPPCRTTLFDF